MEITKLTIDKWAEEDQPREKLINFGAETLSNAELLAILIGSGSTRETAVELMKRVLADCKNNLNTLGKLSITDLTTYMGIGEAKAVTILAACELGKRRQASDIEKRLNLNSAISIYNYMYPKVQDKDISDEELKIMRNYPYAMAGYDFSDKKLKDYFSKFLWYVPTGKDVKLGEADYEYVKDVDKVINDRKNGK